MIYDAGALLVRKIGDVLQRSVRIDILLDTIQGDLPSAGINRRDFTIVVD
jgi:hypothetical protein